MLNKIDMKALRKGINKLSANEKQEAKELLERFNINIFKIEPDDDLTGTKVRGFRLEEKIYKAESHIDVFRQILEIIFLKHPKQINNLISVSGRKTKYFSHDSNELRMPEHLRGTDIYFETNENAKSLCVRCEKVLKLFDMNYTSFEIEYYK
jgi:negative regulator of replication initiation